MKNKITIAIVVAIMTAAGAALAQAGRAGACMYGREACGCSAKGGDLMCGYQKCAIGGVMVTVDYWME